MIKVSSMLQSPPKYLFSIEIEISATVLGCVFLKPAYHMIS